MGQNKITWPDGKQFAFTIIDDTDNSFTDNIKPVYELLKECNILTTKTVWVYPPNDMFNGSSLQDRHYLEFIKNLNAQGFEIALHNVGSGEFKRDEIIAGIEVFNRELGFYPQIHINHSRNPDNIYWGYKRFTPPLSQIMKLRKSRRIFSGEDPESAFFWGDYCKKHIKFIRNHVFNGINTSQYDSKMPYKVDAKNRYTNYWFSSSDGHTVAEFNTLLKEDNINSLEKNGGFCLIYTHFASGFLESNGILNKGFEKSIHQLTKRNGWFVPAGKLLDFLLKNQTDQYPVSYSYLAKLDALWLFDRIIKKIRFGR